MKQLIVISALLVFSITCFSQKGKWKKAQKINTIESYKEFLIKYPESDFSNDATFKLMELEYSKAKKINSVVSYTSFLSSYNKNKNTYYEKSKNDLIDLEFQNAINQGTINSFKFFIQKYPENKYEVRTRILIDSLDFVFAQSVNTWEKHEEYIDKYGRNAKYYSDAFRKAEELLLNEIRSTPEISHCEHFLFTYSSSVHRNEVSTLLNNFKEEKIKQDIKLYFEETDEFSKQRKYTKAISSLDKIITLDNSNVRALRRRARIKYHLKKYKESIDDNKKVIMYTDNDTTFVYSYYDIAHALIKLEDSKQAISKINELVKQKPNFSYSYYYRANLKYVLGNKLGGISDLAKAIQLDNKFTDAYSARGVMKSETGDDKGAIRDFRMVFELDPDYRLAREYLTRYKSSIFTKRETYVGRVVAKWQSFAANVLGAEPLGELTFWLEEYNQIGFDIDQKTAIKWGLMSVDKENPGYLKFSGKDWKVKFTTSNYSEWHNSSKKGDYCTKEVLSFQKRK